ncbi:DNA adenine modification methylase, partial [Vibrio parahaemolyticus]|nr:DNA adenine modification methylase [Vibrio parahaemolyticus]
NCTGHIIKDFIESYMMKPNGLVVDPSIGGGTSTDVANELKVRFIGTDLHQGFNLLREDLSAFLGEPAHLIWWHPPYADMITFSGNMYGEP